MSRRPHRVITTFGGIAMTTDDHGPLAENAAFFDYGGTALRVASTAYDLIVVGSCAPRLRADPAAGDRAGHRGRRRGPGRGVEPALLRTRADAPDAARPLTRPRPLR